MDSDGFRRILMDSHRDLRDNVGGFSRLSITVLAILYGHNPSLKRNLELLLGDSFMT